LKRFRNAAETVSEYAEGTKLYFVSTFPGGSGGNDLWQVPILLNGKPVSK
jgi:hypothetical protein